MAQMHVEPSLSKSQWAYRTVRAMIMSGELEPGTSIDQQALAAQLGISTTPLREGLRRLEAENYVISRDHREMLIAPMSLEIVEQIYQVRLELDPLAARLACEHMTDVQIDALERLIPPPNARGRSKTPANSREFHRGIYVASGNIALIRVMEGLYDQFERYSVYLREDAAVTRKSRDEHVKMCQLLRKRDADGLAKLMRSHLMASLEHCRRDIPSASSEVPGAPARRSKARVS
jgi:DNA-binding GntR family transcriptional regulator